MDAEKAISSQPLAVSQEETSFKACWERFAHQRQLPDPAIAPRAAVAFTVADLRRDVAMQFFSEGGVHQEATRRRLVELLPDPPPSAFARRLPGIPKDGFGERRTA